MERDTAEATEEANVEQQKQRELVRAAKLAAYQLAAVHRKLVCLYMTRLDFGDVCVLISALPISITASIHMTQRISS